MNYFRKILTGYVRCNKRIIQVLRKENLRYLSSIRNPPEILKDTNETPSKRFSIPNGVFGQPTCHTHPHLIPEEQLTCGITQAEYKDRRDTLVRKLVAESKNGHNRHIIVIPAAKKQYMSDNIPYTFRQNSDFFYLTGCLEPAAILVLIKPVHSENYKSIMFVHEKDSHAELWEGPRTGCAMTPPLFCVDESLPVETFDAFINKTVLSSEPSILWYRMEKSANPDLQQSMKSALCQATCIALEDPQRALHFMRVIKSPAEVELMKETCYIGSQSVNMAMACTKPGVTEHQVHAVLEYSCRAAGAEHLAFPPVVAGGARATHIHYVANTQLLTADDMLLVDSGCQRWLYNSDISRTWPISGKFSKHHKILYELVLTVQKRLIEILGEHRLQLDQLFDSMCRLLGKHLQDEGILPKDIDNSELVQRAYRLCPHHVSHYLGLDVHDAPLVRRDSNLRPGTILTVEPGIYIRPDEESVPPEFRGVGIRIEDDVLVTETGVQVLTDSCFKEVADIEAVVGTHAL